MMKQKKYERPELEIILTDSNPFMAGSCHTELNSNENVVCDAGTGTETKGPETGSETVVDPNCTTQIQESKRGSYNVWNVWED